MRRGSVNERVPEGWKNELLDKITNRASGHTPSKSIPAYWDGGIKWVSLADSSRLDKLFINETCKAISEDGIKNSSAVLLPKGTVILSRDAGVGKSAILQDDMAISQHFIAWDCSSKKNIYNIFLYYWLQSKKPLFETQAVGSTIKTIGLPFFKKLKITYPQFFEQQKIAHILTTWDAAIVCTQRLLENSKQQKKALMQQLLIGNQHTVSSVTTWKSYKFSELFTTLCNANNPRADLSENGEYGYIHYGDIHKLTTDFLDCNQLSISKISKNKLTKIELLKEGDLLVADASEDYQGIGKSVEIKNLRGRHIVAGLHTILLRDNKKFLLDGFKGYIQHIPHVSKGLQKAATGISVFGISKRALLDVDVLLPPLDEQKAIAKILTAADALIAQYEVKLAHLQQQKKALMQQLLTGKIRVMPDTLGNAGATPA